MSEQNYAFKDYEKEKMARSIAKNLGISTKKTIEVCSFIRGKKIRSARNFLNRVLKMEDAVPYKRFNQELAHNQRGPSGYPIKVVKEVLKLIGDAEANAKAKGLNPENLKILHISANRGSHAMHYGRQRRRMMKRTHLEIVLQEIAAPASKKASAEKKTPDSSKKSETKKPETKKPEENKIKDSGAEKTKSNETKPETKKSESKSTESKQDEAEKPETKSTQENPDDKK